MSIGMAIRMAVVALCVCIPLSPCGAVETLGPFMCEMGREYLVQRPDNFDPAKTYRLVAVAHGFKGTPQRGLKNARALFRAGLDDFIVVSPQYPPGSSFITLGSGAERQLLGLITKLSKEYKLHPKIFLSGFSGGSQFSHRFAMKHPELTIGCAAHSGGSWGPRVNARAAHIPFAVSCGLDDTGGAMGSRIKNAQSYFRKLVAARMHVMHRYWPGVAHKLSRQAEAITLKCYLLATRNVFPSEDDVIDGYETKVRGALAGGEGKKARSRIARLIKDHRSPGPKENPVAGMTPQQKEQQREELGRFGYGGRSKNGRDYWIEDALENEDGWIDNPFSLRARATRICERIASRLARRAEEPTVVAGERDAAAPLAGGSDMGTRSSEPRKPAERKEAPKREDAERTARIKEACARWDGELLGRVRKHLERGRRPSFMFSSARARARVTSASAEGMLSLSMQGVSLQYAVSRLGVADKASLALSLSKSGKREDHTLAAAYLLAVGRPREAEPHLAAIGDAAGRVLSVFK